MTIHIYGLQTRPWRPNHQPTIAVSKWRQTPPQSPWIFTHVLLWSAWNTTCFSLDSNGKKLTANHQRLFCKCYKRMALLLDFGGERTLMVAIDEVDERRSAPAPQRAPRDITTKLLWINFNWNWRGGGRPFIFCDGLVLFLFSFVME